MSRLIFIFLFCTYCTSFVCGQDDLSQQIKAKELELSGLKAKHDQLLNDLEELKLAKIQEDFKIVGYPECVGCTEPVEHKALSLSYNEKHEQANWVMHMVLPDIEDGNVSRSNNFRKDPLVTTGTAVKADYWYSGFDRGHLAPSADFKWSKTALSESYFYSNMAPQRPELNRRKWAELENAIREYVIATKDPVYIVTGGVLKDDLPTMQNEKRKNEVSIPELFYKVVIDNSGEEKRGIAFIMKNGLNDYPAFSYAVSIDSIEALTGINFFPKLGETLESSFDPKQWKSEDKQDEVLPMDPLKLPKGKFNTIQAQYHIGSKITVCGTVVSTKFSEKSGGTFLNLDKKFPNHVFSVTIWKDARANFSYAPETYLENQKVCITGAVSDNDGIPTMNIKNEKAVELIEE